MRQEKKNEKKAKQNFIEKKSISEYKSKAKNSKKNKRQIEALSAQIMAFRIKRELWTIFTGNISDWFKKLKH